MIKVVEDIAFIESVREWTNFVVIGLVRVKCMCENCLKTALA